MTDDQYARIVGLFDRLSVRLIGIETSLFQTRVDSRATRERLRSVAPAASGPSDV